MVGVEGTTCARSRYKVNKKTIQVPVEWKPDVALLRDMAAARITQLSG